MARRPKAAGGKAGKKPKATGGKKPKAGKGGKKPKAGKGGKKPKPAAADESDAADDLDDAADDLDDAADDLDDAADDLDDAADDLGDDADDLGDDEDDEAEMAAAGDDDSDEAEEDPASSEPDPEEMLDDEDLPDFAYWSVDEEDVLLEAEVDSIGVMHIYGDAKKRTAVWLQEWEAANGDGAPEWYWVIHTGIGPGELEFKRYSSDADDWVTVFTMKSRGGDEAADREMMRRVFGGFVPEKGEVVEFGEL